MNILEGIEENKISKAVIKGMIIGAVIGGVASYMAGVDFSCKCKNMRKKTARVVKNAGRLLNKAADRMY